MISRAERITRLKIAIGSAIAYLLGYPILYTIDREMFSALEGDILTVFIHGHVILGIIGLLWVLGYEWANALLLIVFLGDLLFIARDQLTTGALIVAGAGSISCAYAAYRTYQTTRNRVKELTHDQ